MKTWMPGGLLLLLSGACFVRGGDEKSAGDLDKMQGTWAVVSLTEKGKDVAKEDTDVLEFVFDKDTLTVTEKGKVAVSYRIKLDPGKTPREIDFTHLMGENKDKTEPGIYALDKDQLKMVLDETRKGRPTVFEGKEIESFSVIVLKKKAK